MGTADLVPGVSGGTVALVLGFYRRLVATIQSGSAALGRFARLDMRAGMQHLRRVDWLFLLPLLAGIGLAVVSLSHLMERVLDDYPIEIAALFLGLIASSIIIAWRLLERRDTLRLGIIIVVGAVVFWLLGLRGGVSEDSVTQADAAAAWVFFASGALAICAMILPGISGSLILVMIGMYSPVLGAVNDRDGPMVLLFLAGATLGLAFFSQAVHWALQRHYDTVMAGLIGLMLGSTRVLWPWPNGLEDTGLGRPDEAVPAAVLLMLFGLVLVLAIGTLANRVERRTV